MNSRRLSALQFLVGAALIAWGVFTTAWWTGRIETPAMTADLKMGLVSLTGCTHDADGVWRCESIDWKRVGVTTDSAMWVWSGRLLFGVALATAIALAVSALVAGVPIRGTLPLSPLRLAIAFGVVSIVIAGIYRLSTPEGVTILLDAGRSWWTTIGGIFLGGVGAVRELGRDDRDDD